MPKIIKILTDTKEYGILSIKLGSILQNKGRDTLLVDKIIFMIRQQIIKLLHAYLVSYVNVIFINFHTFITV